MADLSKSPYFDDFNSKKNYLKILYRAGLPVQARELNQTQTIFANQLHAMADNLFKNGTRIQGGSVTFNNLSWVRLNTGADLSWFIKGCIAVGEGSGAGDGSGVEARIIAVSEETETDPATLFVTYIKTGVDGERTTFIEGEQIKVLSEDRTTEITVSSNRPVVRCPACPSNNDTIATDSIIKPLGNKARQMVVEEGIWYYNGYFIETPRHEYIYAKYDEKITAKIGFDIVDTIVTHIEDPSLNDNALGYPNETAAGADRYQIKFILNKRTDNPQDGDKFITLCEILDGAIVSIVADTQYNKIMDVMAQRTYEQAGNYTVKPFKLHYIEHKSNNPNDPTGGSVNGREDYLRGIVSDGLAYVYGYRHEKNHNTIIDVKKARDTIKSENGTIYFNEGAYVDLVLATGANAWANNSDTGKPVFTDEIIEIKDGDLNTTSATGNRIGTLKVWDCLPIGKTSTDDLIYRYYISDIVLEKGKTYKDIKSLGNTAANFAAKPETVFKVINESNRNLFWSVNTPMIKSMREVDNPAKGSIVLSRRIKLNATTDASGTYTWDSTSNLFSGSNESAILSVKDGGVWKTIDHKGKIHSSNNSVQVDLGSSYATREVMLVITAFTVNLVEKSKTLVEDEVTTLESSHTDKFKRDLKLKKADVIKIKEIKSDSGDDLMEYFSLNNGQTPTAYREAFLEIVKPLPKDTYNTITVKFDYFSHSDTAQSGFFTIDSYSKIIESDANSYNYGNLPSVYGSDGTRYETTQIIDFRPLIIDNTISTSYMPATGTTLIHDAECYVPRKDYVCIDKDGKIFQQQGIPALKPEFPHQPPNTMILFEVFIPAYTYSYKDVKVTKIENKRYTMRDIGRLDKRIDNLEYYSTLSLAEASVVNSSITDSRGMERFKNGFIVDNFVNYSVADTGNTEFRALKDEVSRCLRPNTGMFNRHLEIDETQSSNYNYRGGVITLPYTHEKADEQPFASKSVSINECFISKKIGTLKLVPNVNTWSDVTREAKQEWNIDTGVEAIQGLSNQINKVQKDFNDFQVANATVTTPVGGINISSRSRLSNRETTTTGTTTRTTLTATGGFTETANTRTTVSQTIRTTNQVATVSAKESRITPKTTNYSFDRVTDVQITPYMTETRFEFFASGLLPHTKMYLFFDDKDVTRFASTYNFNQVDGFLASNDKGECHGVVVIPSGMFFNGTKKVKLTNDPTNSGDEDMEMTVATAQFFAGGVNISKQEIDLNIISPSLSTENVSYERVVPNSTTSSIVNSTSSTSIISIWRETNRWTNPPPSDPIAQSFTLNKDSFVTKLDLYFHLRDSNITDNIFVEIRKMENGYPSSTQILARKEFPIRDIKTSDDASVVTTIEFDTPIFVNGGEEHCFIVGGYSPLTKVWVAKLGGQSVNYNNKIIDTQPSLGSRFRSQNGTTWNAEQFEDIMYTLYVANFEDKEMNLTFKLKHENEYEELEDNPFECEQGSNLVRVHTKYGHGFIKNDKVIISNADGKWIEVKLNNGKLIAGHTITTNNQATAKVKQVRYADADKTICQVLLSDVKGNISDNDTFTTDSFTKKAFDRVEFIHGEVSEYIVPICGGVIRSGLSKANGQINNIPLVELNKEHTIVSVDDCKTFTIRVTSNALKTGRFGFTGIRACLSHKFELCNLSGSVMIYDGSEDWSFRALKHGADGSIFNGDNYGYGDSYIISRNENIFTDRPFKVASIINEKAFAGNNTSVEYKAKLKRNINNPHVSPIINLDTLSVTFLSNLISHKSNDNKKAPNVEQQYYPETDPVKGVELYKYVTKTITLDEPAADLKIWFDINKPLHTDFDVYIKTSETSGQEIDGKEWVLITGYNKDIVHNDIDDYSEIEIVVNDVLEEKLTLFSACKVKIVAKSKNTAKYPKIKALRVIALT